MSKTFLSKLWIKFKNGNAIDTANTFLLLSLFALMISGIYLLSGAIISGVYIKNAVTLEFTDVILPNFFKLIRSAEIVFIFAIIFYVLYGWQLWQKYQIRKTIKQEQIDVIK